MKKYIQFFVVTTALVVSSCSDEFLDKSPVTETTTENFYSTPAEAYQGLIAVYDVLQREDSYGGALLTSEIASDNCFAGFGTTDGTGATEWDRFKDPVVNQNDPVWKNCYLGIYRANILLENLDKVNWGSDTSLKTKYEAEAKFLRAHFHFELARTFGDIIPLDHTILTTDNKLPRATAAESYALIANDFKFAVNNLGSENYSQPNNANYGRITKWAAEAYLAKVFLFYTDYYEQADLAGVITKAEAISYVNDVVNNSGHALLSDFSQLWLASAATSTSKVYGGEGNTEDVWAIRFSDAGKTNTWNLHEGNRFQVFIAPRGNDIGSYAHGWGAGTVNPALFNAYLPGDTRRDASFINYAAEGLNYDPNSSAIGQRQYTGYSWKKYCPITNAAGVGVTQANGGNFMNDNYEDFIVLRFADVLLMAAELNLATNAGFAQTCLDRVRDRAFKDAAHHVSVSKASIMNERRLELALEGNRYYDLIRQDMVIAKAAIDVTNSTSDVNTGFNVTFRAETLGWFALPTSQISISDGAMSQNPGW